MTIRKSLAALALAGAIFSPFVSSEAQAANYITNFSSTPPPPSITANSAWGSFANSTYRRAILFNSSSSFQLTEISLALASENGYTPTNFSIELYASDGFTPTGTALASATNLTVTTGDYALGTGSVNTFQASTPNASALFAYTANAGTYALVLGGATGTAIYMHRSISAPTANGALSYVGMASYGTSNPSTVWTPEFATTYFAIGTTGTGPSSPSSVPDTGSSAAGLGLAMAGLHLLRRRLHRPLNN
jgi:hypothetical protein